MIVTLVLKISTWARASSVTIYVGDPANQNLDTFTDMSGIASQVRTIRSIVSINAILTWFKAVKYLNIFPYISLFMQTVSMSQRQLGTFVVVLVITLAGFVLGFCVAFGEQQQEFRTPWKSLLFLLRTFTGGANMEVVYATAPLLGSILIMIYVVVMIFLVLNLFFAIMISALADAKQVEDAASTKKYQQNVERAQEVWDAIRLGWNLEGRVRACVPGLYSRVMTRRKKQMEKEQLRDMALEEKQSTVWQLKDDLRELGPGSPTCGRRKLRKNLAIANVEEGDSDDSGSEADLGPLRSQDQLPRKKKGAAGSGASRNPLSDKTSTSSGSSSSDDGDEMAPEAIDLVLEATRHVASSIVQRTKGAKGVLFSEMLESKDVLAGIGNVLDVLRGRVDDLKAQQDNLLLHFD